VAVFAALVAAHVAPLRALARHVPRAAASIAPDGRARLGQVPVPRGREPKAGVHTIAYPRRQAGEGTPYPLPPQLLHVGGCEHWAAKCPIWPHRMHAAIKALDPRTKHGPHRHIARLSPLARPTNPSTNPSETPERSLMSSNDARAWVLY
jgi:hypothetical protein